MADNKSGIPTTEDYVKRFALACAVVAAFFASVFVYLNMTGKL